jgi:fucose permease
MLIIGLFFVAMGFGFLLSAAVSAFKSLMNPAGPLLLALSGLCFSLASIIFYWDVV